MGGSGAQRSCGAAASAAWGGRYERGTALPEATEAAAPHTAPLRFSAPGLHQLALLGQELVGPRMISLGLRGFRLPGDLPQADLEVLFSQLVEHQTGRAALAGWFLTLQRLRIEGELREQRDL